MRIVSICSEIVSAESNSSGPYRGNSTSTAIITSTSISCMTLMPRLPTRPPSTSSRSPMRTGANTPGTDMLARIDWARSPLSITQISPRSISEAMARNGIGRSSNSRICDTSNVSSRSSRSSFCPWMAPFGNTSSVPRTPSSKSIGDWLSSCLRRKLRSFLSGLSDSAAAQSSEPTRSSRSSALIPVA